jgi:hypothetical protein
MVEDRNLFRGLAVTTRRQFGAMLVPVQMQVDRPPRKRGGGSMTEGLRKMRQTRIEKRRRPVRARRYADEERYGDSALSGLDPRDPDVVRAKRLQAARDGGTPRTPRP